jgi:hypothetical protein
VRAPVYRHLDTKASFLGLSFPAEWALVLSLVALGSSADRPFVGMAGAVTMYVFLRVVGYGRPENFLQHWVLFRIRAAYSGGQFSGAARANIPRFPFGPYESRDLPRRSEGSHA